MLSIFKTVLKGLILTAAGFLLLVCDLHASPAEPVEYGIIESALLNIRPAPSNEVAPIGVLKKGTRVTIESHEGEWLKISHGKITGYIRNRGRYVRLFKEGAGKSRAVPVVNFRAAKKLKPGTPDSADKLAKQKADKLAKQKADKLAKQKADKLAKQKADKKAKQKADKKARQKADKKVKQKVDKKAKQKAAKKARQKVDKPARQQADKPARQQAVRKATSESERLGRSIEKQEAEVARFGRKEEMIINGLNEIDLSMNRVRGRIKVVEVEMAGLDEKIAGIREGILVLENEMGADDEYVANRLTALYKLKLMGKINFLASAETLHEFSFRKKAMEKILAEDALLLDRQTKKREGLLGFRAEMEKIRGEKAALEEGHREEVRVMSVEKRKRGNLLSDIRSRKALSEAAVASLRKRAEKLDGVMAEMAEAPPSHIKSAKQHKRLLSLPVKGKIISTFGPSKDSRFDVVTFQSGINIRSDRGEPVQAVMAGKVLYASWFKGYGNMIIIDHGESYYTLYAHAEELFKKNGERVEEREVIATVGETGSMDGVKLHFEVRHHGKPIDPLKWLKRG